MASPRREIEALKWRELIVRSNPNSLGNGRTPSGGVKSIVLNPAWLAVLVTLSPPMESAWAQPPAASTTGTLVATVREEGTGMLLPAVSVTVVHHDGKFRRTGTTTEEGVLRVEDVPPGRCGLYFESRDHLWTETTAVVGAGRTTAVSSRLERAAAVSGQILSPSGSSRGRAHRWSFCDSSAVIHTRYSLE